MKIKLLNKEIMNFYVYDEIKCKWNLESLENDITLSSFISKIKEIKTHNFRFYVDIDTKETKNIAFFDIKNLPKEFK